MNVGGCRRNCHRRASLKMATVVLKNVTKVFDQRVFAVRDANLEVADKEFVVLVGPSGCGKTTTLRMIAGLEEISSGEIYIDGRLVNDIPPKDRDIAMVFQNYALYPHMTVYENMAFGLKLRKYPRTEIDARVREAAQILEIGELLERKPKALSGGQRQRVAVGRAIVRKPRVFLFDEPLSNLDAKFRVAMRTEISKLHDRLGATMIYVTHDQVEAMTMGDRIVVMDAGDIQQIDTPINLYDAPRNKFVAGFIGSPAMNFVEGIIEDGTGTVFNEGSFRLPVPVHLTSALHEYSGKKVVLGIRPESLLLSDDKATSGSFDARVELVEPMGSETFVYARTGNHALIARVDAHVAPPNGSTINLIPRPDKMHFFDAESGAAIRA